MVKIGINGSGRIGSFLIHGLFPPFSEGLELVAINDPVGAEGIVRNLNSTLPRDIEMPPTIECKSEDEIEIDGREVRIYTEKERFRIDICKD
mgnify:CR=1 FL=1